MAENMVADHAIRPVENDTIFTISANAAEAVAKYGRENVINASMGVLLDEEENFVAFNTVYDHLKGLDNVLIAAYAGIEGDADFLETVKTACFRDHMPDAYVKAIATPGGTGAVHHAVCNYSNPSDAVLTSSLYWDPYNTICIENGRRLETYNMYTDEGALDVQAYRESAGRLIDSQKRLLSIFNTPAHNPTGYSVTDEEWDEIIAFLRKKAREDKDNRIVILLDVAYIDFCAGRKDRRAFFEKFAHLEENIITLVAFSASKGYTMYGLRNGAILCIANTKEAAEEFFYTNLHSNRGTWSNGTKGAMKVLTEINNDEKLLEKFVSERDGYAKMLRRRADVFLEESRKVSLDLYTYSDGFFICIPCSNPVKAAEDLAADNLFVIPLQTGLRFAVCAVSEEKCRKSPALIKKAIDKLDEE